MYTIAGHTCLAPVQACFLAVQPVLRLGWLSRLGRPGLGLEFSAAALKPVLEAVSQCRILSLLTLPQPLLVQICTAQQASGSQAGESQYPQCYELTLAATTLQRDCPVHVIAVLVQHTKHSLMLSAQASATDHVRRATMEKPADCTVSLSLSLSQPRRRQHHNTASRPASSHLQLCWLAQAPRRACHCAPGRSCLCKECISTSRGNA